MGGETAGERQEERDQDHRQRQHREADVRDEQRKISNPNETLTLKAHVPMQGVIGNVGNEEERREDKGDEHRHPMPADLLCSDEAETDDKGDSR